MDNELYGLNYCALVQKILQTHGFADGIAFRFFWSASLTAWKWA